MTVAYVWAKPSKYLDLLKLRNRVHNVVDVDHYYRKQKPHITLVPPFKIEDGAKESIREVVDSLDISGTELDVEGLSYHKDLKHPYAVFLEVTINEQESVDGLREKLQPYSRVPVSRGKDPHISLFKTRGWWTEVPDEISRRLNNEVQYQSSINGIRIKSVQVDFRR